MDKLMVVELDPKKWSRGWHGGEETALENKLGRCCLGFVGVKLGIKIKDLKDRGTPEYCDFNTYKKWESVGLIETENDTKLCSSLVTINDMPEIPTDIARVSKLNKVLISNKAKFRFKLKKGDK